MRSKVLRTSVEAAFRYLNSGSRMLLKLILPPKKTPLCCFIGLACCVDKLTSRSPSGNSSRVSPLQCTRSGPDRGGFELHPIGTPHEKELELDELARTVSQCFSTDSVQAAAQAPLERPDGLPFQAVDRVARRMSLGNDAAGEALAPVVVMTLRAREVELTLAAIERCASGFEEGGSGLVPFDPDGHAA